MNIRLFLLTPLREGRHAVIDIALDGDIISTHAPAGGATVAASIHAMLASVFLLTPLREGRPANIKHTQKDFLFLLTPLREGRRRHRGSSNSNETISTHAPAGGATRRQTLGEFRNLFLLTPLREGRQTRLPSRRYRMLSFLLTPLREGRLRSGQCKPMQLRFLLTPLREGRQQFSTSPS